MANIMTKRGQLDNVITYQHFCDTTADIANIESKYCTLGSIAIVLQGDSGGLQIYIANSDKQWNPLTSGIGGGNGGGVANLPLEIVNPSNDDVLTYDSASEKWVNKAATGGGSGGGSLKVGIDAQTMTLDKTWKEIYDALSVGYYVNCVADGEGVANQLPIIGSYVRGPGNYVINGFAIDNDHVTIYEFVADSENGYPVMPQNS